MFKLAKNTKNCGSKGFKNDHNLVIDNIKKSVRVRVSLY